MQKKRGQVTIFVIIAILIIAGILLLFYVKNKSSPLTPKIPKDIQPVYSSLQNCLENKTRESLSYAELYGGIIYTDDRSLFLKEAIPYYNLQNVSLSDVEYQMGLYIDTNLENCTKKIKDSKYSINLKQPKTKVDINLNDIYVKTSATITISWNDNYFLVKELNYNIPSNLFFLFKVAEIIKNVKIINNSKVCLSCVEDTSEKNNVYIAIIDFHEEGVLTLLTSKENELNNQTEVFAFALK
jgi:hypothetical protein